MLFWLAQDAGAASAGRVREVMGLLGPATLTAWLGDRRRQMLQRYCLTRLAKVRGSFLGVPTSRAVVQSCCHEPPMAHRHSTQEFEPSLI